MLLGDGGGKTGALSGDDKCSSRGVLSIRARCASEFALLPCLHYFREVLGIRRRRELLLHLSC